MILFGIALWGGECLQEMFVLKKSYWRERTVCDVCVKEILLEGKDGM